MESLPTEFAIQPVAAMMWFNITWYSIQHYRDWGRSYIRGQTHKRHPIRQYHNGISLYFCSHIEGILPKGPYLPCISMAGRALLAGYHQYLVWSWCQFPEIEQKWQMCTPSWSGDVFRSHYTTDICDKLWLLQRFAIIIIAVIAKINIGSVNGLALSGNKPLPEPMLAQIYGTIRP